MTSFVLWMANLNIKRNVTSMFVLIKQEISLYVEIPDKAHIKSSETSAIKSGIFMTSKAILTTYIYICSLILTSYESQSAIKVSLDYLLAMLQKAGKNGSSVNLFTF